MGYLYSDHDNRSEIGLTLKLKLIEDFMKRFFRIVGFVIIILSLYSLVSHLMSELTIDEYNSGYIVGKLLMMVIGILSLLYSRKL